MLTEVQVGRGSRAGWSSAVSKRRVGAELGGGAGTGVLRALDLPEGVRAGPARVIQSQISPVVTGGDELRRNRAHRRGGRGGAPVRAEARRQLGLCGAAG